MSFFKKIISVFCIFLIVLSAVAVVPAAAADTAVISANDITTYKGYTVSVNIRAENLSNVGSLDIAIYYDSSVVTLKEVKNGTLISGCLVSNNKDVVGVVSSSIASLTGLSGSGTLLTLSFTVKSDCAAGKYPIVVTVGDAYDVNLQALAIESPPASLTVKDNVVQTQTFSLSASATPTSVLSGNITTVSIRNSNGYSFMSGDFIFEYDRDLFVLESAELNSALKTENAVYSVNTSTAGYIKISYISTVATSSYNLYTVKLRAKNTEETSSTLSISCADVYKDNQTVYNSYSTTVKLSLTMEPPAPDYPEVYTVTDGVAFEGGSLSSVLCIEEDSNLAAADFVVSYNTDVLECESVSVSDEVTADNGIVVLNQNFKDGKIKFSYVNQKGTVKALTLINITWKVKENTIRHYVLSTNATGVVDAKFNPVTLTFKTEEGCVYKNVKTDEPDCVNPGAEYYSCSNKNLLLSPDTYPESDHPYANSITKEYSFAYDGATALTIKFNSQTDFENSYDKLYIYDKNKKLVGTYTGTQLSGAEITVASDAFTLRLTTDGSVQNYGFKIDSIYAQNMPCNKSETIVKELPATGVHTYGEWTVVTNPTLNADGSREHSCTQCGAVENTVIPAIRYEVAQGVKIDFSTSIISGIDAGTTSLNGYITIVDEGYTWEYETQNGRLGTDAKVILKNGDTVAGEYTILIFGDVNGDSWYDGMDAVLVSCLANGMLTKDDVSEAVYMAADCNHDGVIDQLDVDLLNEAGALLVNVDQSKPAEVLLETSSAYVEYLDLIVQSFEIETEEETEDIPEADAEETPEVNTDVESENTTPEQDNAEVNIFEMIINFIKSIFEMLFAYIPVPLK